MMAIVAPPETVSKYAQPGHAETVEQVRARYHSIASDLVSVVFDPAETTPYGQGFIGRLRTGALVLAVATMESGFARDVDVGPCYRGPSNQGGRCDAGRSACLLQIQVGIGNTKEGWSRADLTKDRKKCFKAGLRMMRQSISSCRKNPPLHGLAAYASGTCSRGLKESEARMKLAERLFGTPGRPKEQ